MVIIVSVINGQTIMDTSELSKQIGKQPSTLHGIVIINYNGNSFNSGERTHTAPHSGR